MKLGNRGFAVSGVLYSLLILFIVLMLSILAQLATSRYTLNKIKQEVVDRLDGKKIDVILDVQIISRNTTSSSITVEARPNVENAEVVGYEFALNGKYSTRQTSTTKIYTGLKSETVYEMKVKIIGADGKESESNTIRVTTLGIVSPEINIGPTSWTAGEAMAVIKYPVKIDPNWVYDYSIDGKNWLTPELVNSKPETGHSGNGYARITKGTSVQNYSTSGTHSYSVPTTGTYILEVWGAQGGGTSGGNGGYAKGTVSLTSATTLTINVGGNGNNSTGGTNGGGTGGTSPLNSGGGATDIRVAGTTLNHRIIVAGGGGGSRTLAGGASGGNIGVNGVDGSSTGLAGGGGNQSSGGFYGPGTVKGNAGSFGLGGNKGNSTYGSGGGGGWYGGGSGGYGSGPTSTGGGGGGSSYVLTSSSFRPTGYAWGNGINTYAMTNAYVIPGNGKVPSPTETEENTVYAYVPITSNKMIIARVKSGETSSTKTAEVVNIDKVAPTFSVTGNPTEWAAYANIIIVASDAESGLADNPYSFDDGATWTSAVTKTFNTNNITVTMRVRDKAGNISDPKTITITKIDEITPGVSIAQLSKTSGQIGVRATATSVGGSGVKNYQFSTDNVNWTTVATSNTTQDKIYSNLVKNTQYTFYVKVTGNNNLVSNVASVQITTDNIGSVSIVPSHTGVVNQNVTTTITYPSPKLSGWEYEYSLNGGVSWTTVVNNPYVYTFSTSTSYSGTIIARVSDTNNSNNNVSSASTTVTIDKIAPTINSVSGNTLAWTQTKTLVINAIDTGGAGLHATPYSFDNGASWQAGASKEFNVNQTVNIRVRDAAGNVSTKSEILSTIGIEYTVTWDAQGGIASETTRSRTQGDYLGTLPTATRTNYEFGGWFTSATGGLLVDANYTVNSNVTFYARWGQGSTITFGDATTQFNIKYNGDRTNYNDLPYDLYGRYTNEATANLVYQTGISSPNMTNNITTTNKTVSLYLKITNNGAAGTFNIGFDCDSFIPQEGSSSCRGGGAWGDCVVLKRISKGVQLGNSLKVEVEESNSVWIGNFSNRTSNRYIDSPLNTTTTSLEDTGYAFTINNIFINNYSYAILEVKFTNLK